MTGSGRAFCAGMDLTTDGNVFGLDETLEPTLHDMGGDLQDPIIARASATPAVGSPLRCSTASNP